MIDRAMVRCNGCGFNVEREDVVESSREESMYAAVDCETCANCHKEPKLKEAYRRGFNAGLDALAKAVEDIVQKSNLRKR
jgi:hypothetical protein